MNAQTHLSELDGQKLINLRLRQQLLTNETEAFKGTLFNTYGNPDEDMTIGPDNSISRTPRAVAPVAPPDPKGKGERRPNGR